MQIVNFGNNYEIYQDSLKTYTHLPAQTYIINFNPMSGFSLSSVDDLSVKESKVYGKHQQKVDKVLRTFNTVDRSLGVLLSGDKGIGKTMSLQLLAAQAIDAGMPVILVDKNYPGITKFINSVQQEALIIFDEFEKTFPIDNDGDSNSDKESQSSLLTLFDGTGSSKRLYAVTINNIYRVSEYLINRPGRFHYHFRYDYPTYDEVMEYLSDKCNDSVDSANITAAANFSMKVPLNFDMLRAIALELSFGESFESAIGDLNILSMSLPDYWMSITLNDDSVLESEIAIDMFQPVATASIDPHHHKNTHNVGGNIVLDTTQLTSNKKHFVLPKAAIESFEVTVYGYASNERTIKLDDVASITLQLLVDEFVKYDI